MEEKFEELLTEIKVHLEDLDRDMLVMRDYIDEEIDAIYDQLNTLFEIVNKKD